MMRKKFLLSLKKLKGNNVVTHANTVSKKVVFAYCPIANHSYEYSRHGRQ